MNDSVKREMRHRLTIGVRLRRKPSKKVDYLERGPSHLGRNKSLFWIAFAVIAVISLAADLTKFRDLPPQFIGHADQANIASVARNIAEGKGAVVDSIWLLTGGGVPGNEIPIPEPYWSIYVAGIVGFFFLLFGSSLTTMLVPAAILKIAIGAISAGITLRITNSKLAAFAVAVPLLYHPMMTRSVNGLSDIYLTFFMLSAAIVLVYAILRSSRWLFFLFGLIIGIAIGVKPSGLLLLGLLVGYILFYGDLKVTTRNSVFVIIGITLGLLPLIVHNYQAFGSVISPGSLLAKEAGRVRMLTLSHDIGFFSPESFPEAQGVSSLGTFIELAKLRLEIAFMVLKKGLLIPYFFYPFVVLGLFTTIYSIRSLFIYRGANFEKLFGYISLQMVIAGLVLACTVHWETRYWNFLIPFLVIVSVTSVARLTRQKMIRATIFTLIVAGSLWSFVEHLRNFKPKPIPKLYAQASSILPRDAIVFTSDPWEFSFHTRLRSVMLPVTSSDSALLSLSERYGVGYIAIVKQKVRHPKYRALVEGDIPDYLEPIQTGQWLTILKFK